MNATDSLIALGLAKKWVQLDPNEKTRTYVQDLIEKEDNQKLVKLFPTDGSRIEFGTAGLRSAMQPGPLGMNDLVIIQTTQGLSRYCQNMASSNRDGRSCNDEKLLAVVGFDHRANPDLGLSSKIFALLTKLVFLEAGFECFLFDDYVATPLIAFATTYLNAACGIMITASHNPKVDAGYKVYWNDGTQIRPPIDAEISSTILEDPNQVPWVDYESVLKCNIQIHHDKNCFGLGDETLTSKIIDAYYETVSKSGLIIDQSSLIFKERPPKICYTAMHGVGYKWALRSFQVFNLQPFLSVSDQEYPDYEFPTVSFPNPEEKGALNLAQKFSEENECDIILANDPDADRLAVAEKDRINGTWTTFTGDQIGTMLGLWLWETIGKQSDKPVAMCASTVSSKMLHAISEKEGFHFEDTLTGFKWIGSRANELRQKGYKTIFAYEEAIGFCCGDVISDKDGLTAIGVMATLANDVYSRGSCLLDHLQSLYNKYGEFVCNNGYYFCYDPSITKRIIDRIRNGNSYVTHVGIYEIESIRDLGYPGYDSSMPDKKPTLPVSKSSPMLTLKFTNKAVIQIRASGTEPKLKYYIEMQGKPGVMRENVEKELQNFCEVVLKELFQPEENGLIQP